MVLNCFHILSKSRTGTLSKLTSQLVLREELTKRRRTKFSANFGRIGPGRIKILINSIGNKIITETKEEKGGNKKGEGARER